MANHKLPSFVSNDIRDTARNMLQRPAKQLEPSFPLDADDVQLLLLDPEMIEYCRILRAKDISGVGMIGSSIIRLSAADVPKGWKPLPRDVVFSVDNVKLFYPKYTAPTIHVPDFAIDKAHKGDYNEALIKNITEDKWEQLLSWLKPVIRARRREHLGTWFVERIMKGLSDTTTLHLLWPQLATFVTEDNWKHRINEVSNRHALYMPESRQIELVNKYRAAVEEILADCALTEVPDRFHRVKFAKVLGWEFLPGEWKPEAA